MTQLSLKQEAIIQDFTLELSLIDGPDDMFPPEGGAGVREPRPPVLPIVPLAEHIELAPIYDITAIRQNRRAVMGASFAVERQIEMLLV